MSGATRPPRASYCGRSMETTHSMDIDALAAAVVDRLSSLPFAADLVDAEQAGSLLGVPSSWVRAEARADRIPHVRLGRYVRFDPVELRVWWQERRRGPWRTGCGPVSDRPSEPENADDRRSADGRDTAGATNGAR